MCFKQLNLQGLKQFLNVLVCIGATAFPIALTYSFDFVRSSGRDVGGRMFAMAGYDRQNLVNVNRALEQFFEHHRPVLEAYKISELTYSIKRDVAVMSQVGALWARNDWKKYANNMGINNALLLAEIESAAMMLPEMPLFLVMDRVLSNSSINVIIDCMKNMQRYDILNYLHSYVIGLLDLNVEDD